MAKFGKNLFDKSSANSSDRRSFIRKSVLTTVSALLGAEIIHAATMPEGYIPIGLSLEEDPMKGKNPEMIIRSDQPWNVEARPHQLDDAITPFENIFIRNNGLIPEDIDATKWSLTIGGESVNQE